MKLKMLALSLLIAPMFASAACPDLAGRYSCRVSGFTKSVVISQVVRSGVTIYQVDNGGEILADGIRHQTQTLHPILDRYAKNYSYVANCGSNRLAFNGVAELTRGGEGTVEGTLVKNGTDVAINMHMVTPDKDMNIDLDCSK